MLLRLILTGVLVVGVLSGFVQGSTVAYFTGQAESTGNQFVSGSVTLAAGIAAGDTLSVSDLVPGDSFVAGLTLDNDGTLPLWYSMTTEVTGSTFANALLLTVRPKTSNPCSSLDGGVAAGPMALDGGVAAGPMALAGASFGNPAVGSQAGDRSLAAGASETLCFQIQLPASASPTLEGTNATASFTFLATQE